MRMAEHIGNSHTQSEPSIIGVAAQNTNGMITTDLLIIGTGPAGAALACFLTSHGKHEILDILQFTD
jgi:NADPH-dependent 2,4-dienoyl-CoA reductase/sulfur reductase-like enzyme